MGRNDALRAWVRRIRRLAAVEWAYIRVVTTDATLDPEFVSDQVVSCTRFWCFYLPLRQAGKPYVLTYAEL